MIVYSAYCEISGESLFYRSLGRTVGHSETRTKKIRQKLKLARLLQAQAFTHNHNGPTIAAMNDSDAMSELSLTELNEGQEDLMAVCEPVGRQFFCKVFGCPKVYSHSSSLYRHNRSAHSKHGPNVGTSFKGSEQSNLNPNQNIFIPSVISIPQNGTFQSLTNNLLVGGALAKLMIVIFSPF